MATQTASSSSSSSSSSSWKYDVFISFCGVDTRKTFIDHLYTALKQKGIITFRDDEELERGKYISAELLKAIEESKYAIVVLSPNYASSRWCLIELAKIVRCMKEIKLTVLPVFYHLDPSDVRNQMGTLVEAFAEHEKDPKVSTEDVQAWKVALKEVGNISGWHLHDRHESIVIQEILKSIFTELNCKFSSTNSKDLVGIDSRVKEMLDLYLNEGLSSVRFVGICGMGGMGKTTLTEEIYKKIASNFETSIFIANIREETKNQRLVSLQKQLLSKILMESKINIWDVREGVNLLGNRLRNKKVLIFLDDVDREEQLEALAGKHDWYGLGSRIIVTSRDSHLLRRYGMDDIYTTKGLNDDEALELFSCRAFKKPHPEENYGDLSKDFVNYANGLPLALKVLGSALFGRRIDAWKSARDKLKAELDRGTLWMHDLLQEMGQEIVRRESPKEPGGRSRLWLYDDILHVLKNNTGTEVVEGIVLKIPIHKEEQLNAEAFSKMKNLRLLKIGNVQAPQGLIRGNVQILQGQIKGNLQLPQGLNYLPNELRIIEWHGYPLKSMPTSFEPNKLVEFIMHCSNIKQLWKGTMQNLDGLKLIDLSDSQNLIETPNLSGVPNLKQLILRHCTRLYKIHESLGNLKLLIRLDLNGCECLESFPHKINLESLEIFVLSGCSRLKKFPEIVGNMSRLSELYLNKTAIKDLPLFVEYLTGLIKLDLGYCKKLSSLPDAICSLTSLKTLSLSGCSKLYKLPENLGNLEGLEELDLSETAIRELPSLNYLKVLYLHGCKELSPKSSNKFLSFPLMHGRRSPNPMAMLKHSLSGLWSLTDLDLSYCNLQAIPYILGSMSSLKILNLRGNNFVCLPKSIIELSKLQKLYLSGCTSLQSLPKLPLNIKEIDATECTSLETLSLRPEDDFYPYFCLLNCEKLIENQGYSDMLLTMPRRYFIKKHCKLDEELCGLQIPGSEIPSWFSHQSVGESVNAQVPSDLWAGNKH
nr:TMV resistance protein N-like [Quercus suber]